MSALFPRHFVCFVFVIFLHYCFIAPSQQLHPLIIFPLPIPTSSLQSPVPAQSPNHDQLRFYISSQIVIIYSFVICLFYLLFYISHMRDHCLTVTHLPVGIQHDTVHIHLCAENCTILSFLIQIYGFYMVKIVKLIYNMFFFIDTFNIYSFL